MSWIVVPNWGRFQHYGNRQPIWIKNYTALLHKDEYLELSPASRGILHGIWLAYAQRRGRLSTGSDLAAALHTEARATSQLVRSLSQAGLVEFSASRPLYLSTTPVDAPAREAGTAKRRVKNWIGNGTADQYPLGDLADIIRDEFKVTDPAMLDELVQAAREHRA